MHIGEVDRTLGPVDNKNWQTSSINFEKRGKNASDSIIPSLKNKPDSFFENNRIYISLITAWPAVLTNCPVLIARLRYHVAPFHRRKDVIYNDYFPLRITVEVSSWREQSGEKSLAEVHRSLSNRSFPTERILRFSNKFRNQLKRARSFCSTDDSIISG